MFKKLFTFFAFITIAFTSVAVVSAERNSEVSDGGSLYYSSDKLETVDSNVKNDLVYGGQGVIYKGDIDDNLYAFGESIQVDGNVKGDIIIIAANIVINGNVEGDVRLLGYNVYINSKEIGGDVNVGAFNYGISKETEVLGSQYTSSQSSIKSSDLPRNVNEIDYKMDFENILKSADFEGVERVFGFLAVFFGAIFFLGNLILSYLVLRFFPAFSHKVIKKMQSDLLNSTAIGLTLSILSPFIAIILVFSLIGWPILMMLFVLFALSSILSWIYFKYISGDFILKSLNQNTDSRFLKIFVGSMAVDLLFVLFTILGGFGGLLSFFVSITAFSWFVGSVLLSKFGR